MSNSTQNDWEDEIKDMLSDAGLKPIHFMLNNSGVRILNRIREELADARKEVMMDRIDRLKLYEVIENIYLSGWYNNDKGVLRQYMSDIINILAILREEEEK